MQFVAELNKTVCLQTRRFLSNTLVSTMIHVNNAVQYKEDKVDV